ncbi:MULTISPECIES: hypothetical protein [Streptomyces]|uniref:Uncharacterized protein n=2 Tax=Streptomyces violaceusniger group TaxID=2839105 RepID=A0A1H4XY13_STRMJ|nr:MULTISPECIES: hypothetical protein [Streptomyces]AEM83539.1 hypothetical protein Strvi_3877 [Streptomyces violaceusniger Tu 4113]MBO3678114.1 hypothetical protein [Streptomyces sp. NEAU-YJ-81]MCG0285023.1 hypothetical protein [Streptomyces sp. PSAA01]SED10519.1 hypothetical protein SAMN04490356_6941 [Streptomyces melanosporofaciens]
MHTMEVRPPVPSRSTSRWRRYGRLAAANFVRGASYACGTAAIGLMAWWVQTR